MRYVSYFLEHGPITVAVIPASLNHKCVAQMLDSLSLPAQLAA